MSRHPTIEAHGSQMHAHRAGICHFILSKALESGH
jgi:hypothetical protein